MYIYKKKKHCHLFFLVGGAGAITNWWYMPRSQINVTVDGRGLLLVCESSAAHV
jgi:hypothetical protein